MNLPEYHARLSTGIVHFGPGAFHRAHQADYVHRLLHDDPRWGIAAVSLRTRGTIDALARQNGAYTLVIRDRETSFRTIAAHQSFFKPGDGGAVRCQLLDPSIRILSSTVTEKGYCLAGDGTLDFGHADIVRDLQMPQDPISIVGWIARGFADRRASGLPPFTVICCDNMASNGRKLQAAVLAFAERLDPELARWIHEEGRFPNTVVDSITPATDEALREQVRFETGFEDAVPVSREAYCQWVIEDVLPEDSPDLASVGVVLTADVAAWEKAKLRILNGAHSTIAYLGLLLGHKTVGDAMADPHLSAFVQRLIERDIIPSLEPSPIDLRAYAVETLQRFRNPVIDHRLSQIAWDGSQKLPYRLLDTIADSLAAGRPVGRLAIAVAAWIHFVERQARKDVPIVDPLADQLGAIATGPDPVGGILRLRQIFPAELALDPAFTEPVADGVERLRKEGPATVIGKEAEIA